jgi:rhamnosyltransferase
MTFSKGKSIKLAAVIVFYKPDQTAMDNLKKIASQMDLVIVVCNSDGDINHLELDDNTNIIFLKNLKNQGLGAALNQGALRAFSEGFSFLCTFDQDTTIFKNFRQKLISSYLALSKKYKVGILAPSYKIGNSSKKIYHGIEEEFLITTAVQSGCLFTKECIDVCGKFREDFFIESIDTEFCLRAQNSGFKVGCCNMPIMEHGAGERLVKKIFSREIIVTNHSVDRLFLQYRNYTFTFKLYWLSNPAWAIKSFLSMIKKYIIVCWFEDQKKEKGKSILRGVYLGLLTKNTFNNNKFDL